MNNSCTAMGVDASCAAVAGMTVAQFVVCLLANFAGVGGGAALLCFYCYGLGQSFTNGAALCNLAVFPGALVMTISNLPKRLAGNSRTTLINYGICVLTSPMLFLGETLGMMLPSILPDYALGLVMGPVVYYLAYVSFDKLLRLYYAQLEEDDDDPAVTAANAAAAPVLPAAEFVGCIAMVLAFHMGLNSAGDEHTSRWILFGVEVVIATALALVYIIWCRSQPEEENNPGTLLFGDNPFSTLSFRLTLLYQLLFCLSGVATTALGTGTGSCLNPVYNQLKLGKKVIVPTTCFMVCLATGVGCLHSIITGHIPRNFGLLVASTSFATGCVAVKCQAWIQKFNNRDMWSVGSLAVVNTTAAVLIFSIGYKMYIAWAQQDSDPSLSPSPFPAPSP